MSAVAQTSPGARHPAWTWLERSRACGSRGPLILLVAAALGALATGCQDSSPAGSADDADALDATDAAARPGCVAATGPIDPAALIDNFESGSSMLPMIAGRTGGWYAEGDSTPTAVIQPSGPAAPEVIPGGRCESRHALHVTGSGFLDWGSEVSVPLDYGTDDAGVSGYLPYDASQYQGMTFFARIGDTSTNAVWFGISDEYARPEAGICVIGGGVGTGCYDAFGIDLTSVISTDWQQFHIAFTELAQRKFGVPSSANAIDTSMIYDIELVVAPDVVFDLWIDDISFY
jgi:hypothetical protein